MYDEIYNKIPYAMKNIIQIQAYYYINTIFMLLAAHDVDVQLNV